MPSSKDFSGFRPLRQIYLQGTQLCNLNCDYCYISEDKRRKNQSFSLESMDLAFRNVLGSKILGESLEVVWHSGEPLLQPISYYEQAHQLILSLGKQLAPQIPITFKFVTNATRLNAEWCQFFKDSGALVSISCDGPAFLHDQYRKTWADEPTHHLVMKGILLLKQYQVPLRIVPVITAEALEYPEEFFNFFIENDFEMSHFSLEDSLYTQVDQDPRLKELYINFLWHVLRLSETNTNFPFVFDWYRILNTCAHDMVEPFLNISTPYGSISSYADGSFSTFSGEFGIHKFLENIKTYDGSVIIGNLLHDSIDDVLFAPKTQHIWNDIKKGAKSCRGTCEYFNVCGGTVGLSVKLLENGSFASSETSLCRTNIQLTNSTIVDYLESKRSPVTA